MTHKKRPPSPDVDQELDALFASMKQDRPPADVEDRILHALGPALGTGALAAKTSAWSRLAGLFKASTAAKLGAVGLVSGGVAVTSAVLLDAPSAPRSPVLATAAPSALLAPSSAPLAPPAGPPPDAPSPTDPAPLLAASAAPPAPSTTAAPAAERRFGTERDTHAGAPVSGGSAPAPAQAATSAPIPTPPPGPPTVHLDPIDGVFAPLPSASSPPALAPTPPASVASTAPADVLRHEVALVRRIAALVDAGDCAKARPLIAEHRARHATGQLAAEVAVLVARCQGR